MSTILYLVTAKQATTKIATGMFVEIVIRNTTRKPNQREVIDAFNQKYGAGTAQPGLNLMIMDIRKL